MARRARCSPTRGAQVTGITISPAQYGIAASRARGKRNPRFLLGDWLQNDLPSDAFDAAIAIESSEHMAGQAGLLRASASRAAARRIARHLRLAGGGTADATRRALAAGADLPRRPDAAYRQRERIPGRSARRRASSCEVRRRHPRGRAHLAGDRAASAREARDQSALCAVPLQPARQESHLRAHDPAHLDRVSRRRDALRHLHVRERACSRRGIG